MMVAVLLLAGCERNETPEQRVTMPVSICLPADAVIVPACKPGMKFVPGDVGAAEGLLLPRYLYIYIVKQDPEDAEVWTIWNIIKRTPLDISDWEKQYYSGSMMGSNDSVYRYTEEIVLPLVNQQFNGRVYVIASADELDFGATAVTLGSSLDDLLAMQFSTGGEMQSKLQHIYSTPYNYEIADKYYGSFSSITHKVPYVNLMLYHVAAKVDINWDVAEAKRKNETPSEVVRLTNMKVCNLFNGNAYCFRLMENTSGATPLTPAAGTGDTITIVTAADEGLWWEGRSYFYTIPYTSTGKAGYYPLQMQMETNASGNNYRPTIYLHIDTSSPFVPWLRATFNISNPLPAGTDTKTVES